MPNYSSLFSKLLSNPLGFFNIPNFQIYQFSFFAILIFIYIVVRVSLSVAGRKYSIIRLFLGPIFLVLLVAYNYYNAYVASISITLHSIMNIEVLLVPILVILGLLAGHRIARKDRLYMKKGTPHYRSSVIISLVWALSFMMKMGIITYFPLLPVSFDLAVAVILDITTGLILGEAVKIHSIYRKGLSTGKKALS